MRKLRDLAGQQFGKLTVLQLVTTKPRTKWLCSCECGKNDVIIPSSSLVQGRAKSCGCLKQCNKQPLTWKIEDLPIAVQKVKCWEALYAELGAQRGAKHAVKRWVSQLNINTDHFTGEWRSQHTIPDNDVFCENSKHVWMARRRFYKSNPEQCMLCPQGPIWNGKPMRFQIDHKNGQHSDCRWENLQKICPNCHTQTDTFCGRNKVRHNG